MRVYTGNGTSNTMMGYTPKQIEEELDYDTRMAMVAANQAEMSPGITLPRLGKTKLLPLILGGVGLLVVGLVLLR